MLNHYDILVVGAGLFGSVVAREALDKGLRVLVIERRGHIGGNCYTEKADGINIHKYGAHIFRTSDKAIWQYMERFCEFNHFINSPIANYKGELYNLPFNMNTFHALWGVSTPDEALEVIDEQTTHVETPTNLEEHVLSMVGVDIYEKLIKGYTEKQWGMSCAELPPSIMRRIPLRFTYDNNYFRDPLQGIPVGGYTAVFEKMLDGADVLLGTDYLQDKSAFNDMADMVVYTGPIDEFYQYEYGPLGYRGLRFEEARIETVNYQGVAVMNFTDREIPYTRIIEHKHFEFGEQPVTIISKEYPIDWKPGGEPYYPMEDADNLGRYELYRKRSEREAKVHFGGRLGEYRYYDMQDTIKSALDKASRWI